MEEGRLEALERKVDYIYRQLFPDKLETVADYSGMCSRCRKTMNAIGHIKEPDSECCFCGGEILWAKSRDYKRVK